MTLRHLLFDFFGTLVGYSPSRTEQGYEKSHEILKRADSTLDYEEFLSLWARISADFDREAERTLREYSMVEVVRAFLAEATPAPVPPDLVATFIDSYLAEWNKGVRYPGDVAPLLEDLSQRFTLSIITNTHDPELVPQHLEAMGIRPLFREVITSVTFRRRKPDPAIFHHALERLSAKADECVYVGDNFRADFEGGEGAGIRSLLLDPGATAPIPDSSRLCTLSELTARIQTL